MKFNKRDADRIRRIAEGSANGDSQHAPQKKPRARRRQPEVTTLPPESEAKVAKACLSVLERLQIWTIRTNAGSSRIGKYCVKGAPAGTSDRIGQLPDGRFLAIEFKRRGELPRRDQIDFLVDRNRSGGVAFWVDNDRELEAILRHVLAGGGVELSRYGKVSLSTGTSR